MAATSHRLLKGERAQLRRCVVEIRYSRSGQYFTRFGAILDVLSETRPDWFLTGDNKPAFNAAFLCASSGLDASVADTRVTLTLTPKPDLAAYDQLEVNSFASECDHLTDVYTNNANPKECLRIGFRQFYEADFATEESAAQWKTSLGLLKPNSGIAQAFGCETSDVNYSFVVERDDYATRIAVDSGRKPYQIQRGEAIATVRPHMLSKKQDQALKEAQKKSAWLRRTQPFAVTLDLDSYVEFPNENLQVGEFIRNCHRETIARLSEAVGDKQ